MIDTPGHVDFTYEVSRSLAACEGAVLLVDAAQGIEAQTLANLYLAMENDLTIIPVLNKIDLPAAQPEKYAEELAKLIGVRARGLPAGVRQDRRRRRARCSTRSSARCPPRSAIPTRPARAMIFDSVYDTYRGVVTYVRVIDGNLSPREKIVMMSTRATHELLEIGVISPEPVPTQGPRRRRGRLPDHRREGRAPVARRRHGHQREQAGGRGPRRLPRPQADGLLGPVSRSTGPTTRRCARPSTSSSSTTPRSSTSRRRRPRSASASASASSACSTSRSSASGSSASSTSTSSRPHPTSSTT